MGVRKPSVKRATKKRKVFKKRAASKKAATAKKPVARKKCPCKTVSTKSFYIIGVLHGAKKGFFTGKDFDTESGKAVLFTTQAQAKQVAKSIPRLPQGARLFLEKK